MLRTPRWRYIRYRDGGTERYNMGADPWELVKMAEKRKLDRALDEGLNRIPVINRK